MNHEFLHHEVLRGGDLNVNSPHFEENFDRFVEAAFHHPDEEEDEQGSAKTRLETSKATLKNFLERENRDKLVGGRLKYPEYVYKAAEDWHGNHLIELNREYCKPREVPINECQKLIVDVRIPPTTTAKVSSFLFKLKNVYFVSNVQFKNLNFSFAFQFQVV